MDSTEQIVWFIYRNLLPFNWMYLYAQHVSYSKGEMARYTGKCPCALCVKKLGGISWNKLQNYLQWKKNK